MKNLFFVLLVLLIFAGCKENAPTQVVNQINLPQQNPIVVNFEGTVAVSTSTYLIYSVTNTWTQSIDSVGVQMYHDTSFYGRRFFGTMLPAQSEFIETVSYIGAVNIVPYWKK
jgi:hypothetical protein